MTSLTTLQITKPHPIEMTIQYTGQKDYSFGFEEREFLVVIPSQLNFPKHKQFNCFTHQFPYLQNDVKMTEGIMHSPDYQSERISGFEDIEVVLRQWFEDFDCVSENDYDSESNGFEYDALV